MREKYKSLSLVTLRELAKARGLRGISALKKEQLIERMLEEDEKNGVVESPAVSEPVTYRTESQISEPGQAELRTEKDEEIQPETKPEARMDSREDTRTENKPEERYGGRNEQAQSQDRMNRRSNTRVFNGRTVNGSSSFNGGYNNNGYNSNNSQEQRRRRYDNGSASYGNNSGSASYGSSNSSISYGNNGTNSYSNISNGNSYSQNRGYQKTANERPQNPDRMPVERISPERAIPDRSQSATKYNQLSEAQMEEQIREADAQLNAVKEDLSEIDSGNIVCGILEVVSDNNFGFIRSANYMPGDNDVYVSPSQIRRFNLKTGDIVCGSTRIKTEKDKFSALLYVTSVNGYHPSEAQRRPNFEDLTPIFPNERLLMERPGGSVAMRVMDLIAPVGKGQRGMIVSQPKAGKTTLLKEIAKSVTYNNPEMHLIILLIDERPEEVTDIKEAIEGDNVEVIYSTFDEQPEHHKKVSEMVIERARRLVEHKQDVMILLDSITRLARAYNLTVAPSGRTLSGGLDPAALHMPKRFFGAARNMREGGSLTILATALVETGSKMDDVVFEEFKGTGNMELVLDRKLSEKRIFPAIDIVKSGTRREDLLLSQEERAAVDVMRRAFNGMKGDDAVETILNMFAHTRNNADFINQVRKNRFF